MPTRHLGFTQCPKLGDGVDQGLVMLGAWAEYALIVLVLGYLLLRQREDD